MASQNVLVTQLTLGTISAGVLAYLKTAKWAPFVNKHSYAINHAYLLMTSAFGALGIHYTWDATNHSLTITGLSLSAILWAIWKWAEQWSVQYLIQRGAYGPIAVPGDAPPQPAIPVNAAGDAKA